jgi:glycosyltransferase involved in cell wall biosynthesis
MLPAVLQRETKLSRLAVVVPAWQPGPTLAGLVRELMDAGFGAVIVVDDGSSAACSAAFAAVEAIAGVRLLRHSVNRGKGCALKTGFAFVLAELPDADGVVTADADGQHRAADVARVGAELERQGQAVLGVRTRLGEGPWRSRIGNTVTRRLFAWLTGVHLADTQTGLRGVPRATLADLMALPGERYEFEMAALAQVCKKTRPAEVEIDTVYEEGNQGSHFDPVWDSLRVMLVLLRCRR